MSLNSSAIIQSNTLTENNVSWPVFCVNKTDAIKLSNVVFTRNNFMMYMLCLSSHSSATIQDSTFIENNISWNVFSLKKASNIWMNSVVFIRNRLMQSLLLINSNSIGIIQSSTLSENNISFEVYSLFQRSAVQLINSTFKRNRLMQRLLDMESKCNAKLDNNTIIENNVLRQMFFAHSSYFEISTTLIESNTFSKLIWVFACNVIIDSMKIRENNAFGRMRNAYIESRDSIASAVTVTCTHLGYPCLYFEIKNVEIIWSYKLRFSALPVIQLNEKVVLSNVRLLVTSVSKIEVLRYSTEDVMQRGVHEHQVFSNTYNISLLFIGCTKANAKHIKKLAHLVPGNVYPVYGVHTPLKMDS